MRRIPHSKHLHELLKSNCLFKLECLGTDVLEVLLRDEVPHSIEHALEFSLSYPAFFGMQVEDLKEGLPLGSLEGILVLPGLLLLHIVVL